MIIELVVMLGSVSDLILTYNFLKLYKEKFPKKDFLVVESNPLIKNRVRAKGLQEGMFQSAIIILSILIMLLHIIPIHWKYFLLGVYYMMVTFHLTNFLAIKRDKGGKTNVKRKK